MRTGNRADELIDAYIATVMVALGDLPSAQRDEIVAGIAEHISAARLDSAHETEASIRSIFDELGDPSIIAAAARSRSNLTPMATSSPFNSATVPLLILVLGGFLVPVVGTVMGAILVAGSSTWTRRDKYRALALGVLVPLAVLIAGVSVALARGGDVVASTIIPSFLLLFVLAGPLMATAYLWTHRREEVPVSGTELA